MIFLSAPTQNGNESKYVNDALKSNYLAPIGKYVDLFREKLCIHFKSENVSLVSSGTSGLSLALRLSGVKEGDNVLASSFTFAGAISPIVNINANAILIGVEKDGNVCVQDVFKAITEYKPKAIIITHILGKKTDFSSLISICREKDIKIIEDVAQTIGNGLADNHSKQESDYAVYSFNGNKMITTSGGGAIVCRNTQDTHLANILITQGIDRSKGKLECVYAGYNYSLSNVLCALGLAQLEQIEHFVDKRMKINKVYAKNLDCDGLIQNSSESVCWLSGAIFNGMCIADLNTHLYTKGIETRRAFAPIYTQEFYNSNMKTYSRLGQEQSIYKNTIMLPSSPAIDIETVKKICKEINYYKKSKNTYKSEFS